MCWNPKYIILLIFVTIVAYIFGIMLDNESLITNKRKTLLAVGIMLIMSLLVFFKYIDFLWQPIYTLLTCIGYSPSTKRFDILLPVGISFYTFQAVAYMIDIYRKKVNAEKNIITFSLFISFFPQLVAGPIERTDHLMKQLREEHGFNYDNCRDGIMLMVWGFFMKLVIADKAALFVDRVYGDYTNSGGLFLIIATILFGVQIYCDFSGYSTIAMGAAKILGIELCDNFYGPYLSRSVADFWRNWHISLTSWFRDYIYIPLGGNKKGLTRKNINLIVVFLLSGLWHGADWSFVVWGGLNGIYQVVGYYVKPLRMSVRKKLNLCDDNVIICILEIVSTFILVDISWIFFRADTIVDALKIIKRMFIYCNPQILINGMIFERDLNRYEFTLLIISIIILFIVDHHKRKGISIRNLIYKQTPIFRYTIYIIAILFIMIFGTYGSNYGSSFIYFQF